MRVRTTFADTYSTSIIKHAHLLGNVNTEEPVLLSLFELGSAQVRNAL